MRPDINAIRRREALTTPGPWEGGRKLSFTVSTRLDSKFFNFAVDSDTVGINGFFATKDDAEFAAHAREDVPKLLDYIKELESMPLVQLVLERDRKIKQLNKACSLMADRIKALESGQAQRPEVKRTPIDIELDGDVYVSLLELAYTTKLSISEIIENCLRGYFAARGE